MSIELMMFSPKLSYADNQTIKSQISTCASQTDLPKTPSFNAFSAFEFNDMTDSAISTCNENISPMQEENFLTNSTKLPYFETNTEKFTLAAPPLKKSKKFSRKNRPANLQISTKISAFAENSLDSITPPPAITSKMSKNTASKITDTLVLGSEIDACDETIYKKFNITKVLTIMSDNFVLPENIVTKYLTDKGTGMICHKFIQLNDTTCSDISSYFNDAINFMKGDGVTLVHCRAGISRSSTLIMAYLIERHGWSLNEAFTFTKSKRSCVAPNFGFLGQLQNFEENLRKNREN